MSNVDRFVAEREAKWAELTALVDRARGRPERLGPQGLLKMGALYRAAAADLAIARRRFRSESVVARLEGLVTRARSLVYEAEPRRRTVVSFFAKDYWVAVRERPALLAAATGLLLGPAILAIVWAWIDPDRAQGFVPGAFQAVTQPRESGVELGIPAADAAALSSAIFTNNIRVTFLAFAGGIAWCVGTAFVLAFNGTLLGVVAGLAASAGNGGVFVELVAAHGILELSCIVVTAGAGMRLGWALIDPGHRRRADVLAEEGRRAIEVLFGTIPWLVAAGLVEGFVTPAGFGLLPVLIVGTSLGVLYWGLVWLRGTSHAAIS